jgi:hypothetical protein
VQFNAVSLLVRPPMRRHRVEANRRYPHCLHKSHTLFVGWLQAKPDRPLHALSLATLESMFYALPHLCASRISLHMPAKAGVLLLGLLMALL